MYVYIYIYAHTHDLNCVIFLTPVPTSKSSLLQFIQIPINVPLLKPSGVTVFSNVSLIHVWVKCMYEWHKSCVHLWTYRSLWNTVSMECFAWILRNTLCMEIIVRKWVDEYRIMYVWNPYVRMYVEEYAILYVWNNLCIHTYVWNTVCMYVRVWVWKCFCVCVYVWMHVRTCVCV